MCMVNRIKTLATAQGTTITDLEIKCNLPLKSIYKWDKNIPSIDRVSRVAKYLHVDINYLLGTTPYKTKYEEWDALYNSTDLLSKQIELIEKAHLNEKQWELVEKYINSL